MGTALLARCRIASLTLLGLLLLVSSALAELELEWLTAGELDAPNVTRTLNEIGKLAPAEALEAASTLMMKRHGLPELPRATGAFLGAFALERAERLPLAIELYGRVRDEAASEPLAVSAAVRLRVLAAEATERKEDLVIVHEAISEDPPAPCWFLQSGVWSYGTTRQAAYQGTADLRSGELTLRVLEVVRSLWGLAPSYGYLFVLLILAIVVKLLTLPIALKATKAGFSGREGGLLLFLDVAFLVWVPLALVDYVVRMRLDGAAFMWIEDVTLFDITLAVGVLAVHFLLDFRRFRRGSPSFGWPTLVVSFVAGVLVVLFASILSWPSYVLIGWLVLTLVGALAQLLIEHFVPVGAPAGAKAAP